MKEVSKVISELKEKLEVLVQEVYLGQLVQRENVENEE